MVERVVEEIVKRVSRLIPDIGEIFVERVVLGLGYTGVKLSTGHSGLCYTFESELRLHHYQVSRRAGTLAGSPAVEVAGMARSWDIGESIVGVATLNALSQIVIERRCEAYSISEGNAVDHIRFKKGDVVALVGYMSPMVEPIRAKVKDIYILERSPVRREEGVLPDTACEVVLPTADVVVITGTAIANGTIDHLLELSRGARETALVGASGSILPDPLFERGVTIISGVKVVDADRMLQIVSEGGGTPALKAAVKFINIRPR